MTSRSASLSLTSILLTLSLHGCTDPTPSDTVVRDFLYQTVNSYELYRDHFEIRSWERVNGWKDQNDYVVTADVTLESKQAYIGLLAECAVELEPWLKGSWVESSQLALIDLQARMTGTQADFLSYWNHDASKTPAPRKLQELSARVTHDDQAKLLVACDYLLLDQYGSIIDRNLTPDTRLSRRYELRFKQTERGWQGMNR